MTSKTTAFFLRTVLEYPPPAQTAESADSTACRTFWPTMACLPLTPVQQRRVCRLKVPKPGPQTRPSTGKSKVRLPHFHIPITHANTDPCPSGQSMADPHRRTLNPKPIPSIEQTYRPLLKSQHCILISSLLISSNTSSYNVRERVVIITPP